MAEEFIGTVTIRKDVSGQVVIGTGRAPLTITLDGNTGEVTVGGDGYNGVIRIVNNREETCIRLDGNDGTIIAGGNGVAGDVVLQDGMARNRIRINASEGNIWIGGNNADGDIVLFPRGGDNTTIEQATIHLDGDGGKVRLSDGNGHYRIRLDASTGNMWAGGHGVDGDIVLFPGGGDNTKFDEATVHLDGDGGKVRLLDGNGHNRIRLDANTGNLWVGGHGVDGDIVLFPRGGDNENLSQASIHLDGDAGDIKLLGADCAENFPVSGSDLPEPGTILVIGEDGHLVPSSKPYDKRVVGVVSGAGGHNPGIVLNKQLAGSNIAPLALVGKAFCKVEAIQTAIEPGDLLTTSSIPGHAMKADNPVKGVGCIIGKALSPLQEGTGLIPVLIAMR